MDIYRLNQNHIDILLNISKKYHQIESNYENAIKFLINQNNFLIVCEINKEIVGFTLAYELERFDRKENMIYIHEIEVLPNYRKQNIGTKLIEKLKSFITNNNYKIFVFTNKKNIPAVNLYLKSQLISKNDDDIMFEYYI